MDKGVIAFLGVFMLSACSSGKPSGDAGERVIVPAATAATAVPAVAEGQAAAVPQLTAADIEANNKLIRQQLEPCDKLYGVVSDEAEDRATRSFWFRVVGIGATTVVAPTLIAANAAANAPWIAAASGVGGAVIAANDTRDGMGISGVSTLRALTELAGEIGPQIAIAEDMAKQFNVRSAAAAIAVGKCKYFGPRVTGVVKT